MSLGRRVAALVVAVLMVVVAAVVVVVELAALTLAPVTASAAQPNPVTAYVTNTEGGTVTPIAVATNTPGTRSPSAPSRAGLRSLRRHGSRRPRWG